MSVAASLVYFCQSRVVQWRRDPHADSVTSVPPYCDLAQLINEQDDIDSPFFVVRNLYTKVTDESIQIVSLTRE
jgi:hypothetical protein